MTHVRDSGIAAQPAVSAAALPRFDGFALPTSNTTYTPNQFFDVCLPHGSRGSARIVAYMLRKTLGWCDAEGRPQRERFCISYADLERDAGVSRDMIKSALDEAISGHFIHCLRPPQAKSAGRSAISGLYELCWDTRSEYVKDPSCFRGFFAGEGNRTYIPNQFFDDVVRHEQLAVVKVVGSVIRFSIGFQNKFGHRRREIALSYLDIQRYSHIASRASLSMAVQLALSRNYIQRVEEGYFDPEGGVQSRAAVYALKWLNDNAEAAIGQKSVPEEVTLPDRSEKRTGIGPKTVPADRSEKRTGLQIKDLNNNYKQQEQAASFEALRGEGFDERTAGAMAQRHPAHRILAQIEWIDRRKVRTNRLGMLRKAIEENWPRPHRGREGREERVGLELGEPNLAGGAAENAFNAARRRLLGENQSTTS